MLKKQRASYVLHRLNELYPSPPVPLIHKDTYTLLIAVLLSAQCTDSRVNQITPALFKKADNPMGMSTLPIKDIYDIIRPCGLAPQKSKAISGLSSILVEKFNGAVPEDITALESLPGVGHKTASVVISQGFGHPAFAV
ncbi:MAG: endonuclease III domain-containing protein, partial [Pseudomonadales bacterium]